MDIEEIKRLPEQQRERAADILWDQIGKAGEGISLMGYRSDLWYLLSIILAFYKVRGSTPGQMIGAESLSMTMDMHIERALKEAEAVN